VVPGLLLSFQRDNWLSNIIPHGTLGRYLGQRLAIKSAFYLGAFFLLGYLLDSFGKDSLAGFAIIFTIAIAVSLVDFIIFTFMSQKKTATIKPPKLETVPLSLPEYFSEIKEKKLNTFVLFTTFFYLTVGLSSPLYAVYMLNDLHFSYLSYTLVISAEYLARVISAPFWGRYTDKVGNIKVLGIVSRIIPLIPVCWLFCHSLGYLVFVQIISGTCWGAFDLCTQSYLYKVAPQPKKLRYIVYTRFLILLCTAVGGLLGAVCVDGIFPTFGSRILSIFWLSGITRALVVLYLMPKLVDLAVSYGKPPNPQEVDLDTLHRVLASKRGQFYRKQPAAQPAYARRQKAETAASADINQHAGHRKWATHEKPRPAIPEPIPIMKPANADLRLSHYRAAMAASTCKKQPVVFHHRLEANAERLKLRYDLERQLKDLTKHAEEAMTHHGIEDNAERLKLRYHLNPQPEAAAVLTEKIIAHHRIEQNVERLKLRYDLNRQPVAIVARAEKLPVKAYAEPKTSMEKVKSSAGLYRDKVSWAKYMKQTFDTVLQERQDRKVPVMASGWSKADISGGTQNR
jgi:MFS family permease